MLELGNVPEGANRVALGSFAMMGATPALSIAVASVPSLAALNLADKLGQDCALARAVHKN